MNTTRSENWLFLFYFCDDFQPEQYENPNQAFDSSLWNAVKTIESMQALNAPIDVVYQYDSFNDIDQLGLDGASNNKDQHAIRRYLNWPANNPIQEGNGQSPKSWNLKRHEEFKSINTGERSTLINFFQWSQDVIRTASNIVVVFAGLGIGEKNVIAGRSQRSEDFGRTFSICEDKSEADAINPVELRDSLDYLVTDLRGGEPIDVLGFDMSSMQFIEVAYQFAGLARIMVASQNNQFDPFWPYENLLKSIGKKIRNKSPHSYIGPAEIGTHCVKTIGLHYQQSFPLATPDSMQPIVTALDLGQLDVVTRSLDTFFLNMLLALGDQAIWISRDNVFKDLRDEHQRIAGDTEQQHDLISYDIYHMLNKLELHLHKIENEDGVLRLWLQDQLCKIQIENIDNIIPCQIKQKTPLDCVEIVRDQVEAFIKDRAALETVRNSDKYGEGKLWKSLSLIQPSDGYVYWPKLDDYENQVTTGESVSKRKEDRFQINYRKLPLGIQSELTECGCLLLKRLKERFSRLSRESLRQSASTARHLREIAQEVMALLTPPILSEGTRNDGLPGFRSETLESGSNGHTEQRFVVAHYSRIPVNNPNVAEESDMVTLRNESIELPFCCGVSLHRPEHLDRLEESLYLDFEFHRRVHWVPLLAAINLIRKHPGELWKVVSSLLATCTGSGRDELLQRLSGPSSVMHRFGKQFEALQNPLVITLSVSKTEFLDANLAPTTTPSDSGSTPSGSSRIQSEHSTSESAEALTPSTSDLEYKLAVETNIKDATAEYGDADLNPYRVTKSLMRLEEIISGVTGRSNGMLKLNAYAKDLGEDIFQEVNLQRYQSGRGTDTPHLHLQLPVELMGLPWEVMDDGKGMLCERFAIARQTLVPYGISKPPNTRRASKIRVLIIGDPRLQPTVKKLLRVRQLPGAVDEAREVARLFMRLSKNLRGTIELQESDVFISRKITGHDVRGLLRSGKYDIVHFAGHAQHDERNPHRSSWILSDGPLWAQEISNTLKHCKSPPWLVYSNSCESAMLGTHDVASNRNNIYGIAAAFINQGVTAYLGPLWPIGDSVAFQLATDFYNALLLERGTVGESLFFAKQNAKQRIEGDGFGDMSWASMVAYGDATMKLLDSLGIETDTDPTDHIDTRRGTDSSPIERSSMQKIIRPVYPMQASIRSTQDKLKQHPLCLARHQKRHRELKISDDELALELRQINGVRYWQFRSSTDSEYHPLKKSCVRDHLLTNERLQYKLGISRSIIDEDARIVGHWRVPLSSGRGFNRLLESFDGESVKRDELLIVKTDGSCSPPSNFQKDKLRNSLRKRVNGKLLLLIHDGFSSTSDLAKTLGDEFLRRCQRNFVAILGFDHSSLQRSTIDSGQILFDAIRDIFNGDKLPKNSIDIVAHGRGGFVARSLVESVGDTSEPILRKAIHNIALVGTPNFGSRLKDKDDWGYMADLLANCIHLDSMEVYARLSRSLAQLSAISAIGGKLAQDLGGISIIDNELPQLKRSPEGVRYFTVASAYAPTAAVNVPKFLMEHCSDSKYFDQPHDLLVNVADIWSRSGIANNSEDALQIKFHGDAALLICPNLYSNDLNDFHTPLNCKIIIENGIHHTNMLAARGLQDFLFNSVFGSNELFF